MTTDPSRPLPGDDQSPEVSWEKIERLDWQLGALSMLLIFVLGMGLIGFMYPTVFLPIVGRSFTDPERTFYGFWALLGITLGYLLHKQATIRQMRRRGLLTERKRWEKELTQKAFYDTLTGLPNREVLLDRLQRTLARAKRNKDYQFALIFVDLDRFKWVNDSMGHHIGDQLLVQVARKFQQSLRAVDTVARLGGDEFGLLLEDVKQMSDIFHTLERVQKELSSPISLEGREVYTSASMEIALSSTGYEQPEDFLRDADTAMFRAKAQGPGRHMVFDASMHEHAVKVLELETDIRRAIERQELVLHYQPIVRLYTGQVVGLEALVRWSHPVRGLISPDEFLPAAEVAGLMDSITRLLLVKVCRQVLKWQQECLTCWPLSVSINLPPQYLTKENQVEGIISTISEHHLQGHSIRLEITEDQLMANTESINRALLRLIDSGIRVYIDDFGTGFSSLSYLSTFHVDALKIDRSFICNLN